MGYKNEYLKGDLGNERRGGGVTVDGERGLGRDELLGELADIGGRDGVDLGGEGGGSAELATGEDAGGDAGDGIAARVKRREELKLGGGLGGGNVALGNGAGGGRDGLGGGVGRLAHVGRRGADEDAKEARVAVVEVERIELRVLTRGGGGLAEQRGALAVLDAGGAAEEVPQDSAGGEVSAREANTVEAEGDNRLRRSERAHAALTGNKLGGVRPRSAGRELAKVAVSGADKVAELHASGHNRNVASVAAGAEVRAQHVRGHVVGNINVAVEAVAEASVEGGRVERLDRADNRVRLDLLRHVRKAQKKVQLGVRRRSPRRRRGQCRGPHSRGSGSG